MYVSFVNLQKYDSSFSFLENIFRFITDEYELQISFEDFNKNIIAGKIFFIFDALDELSGIYDKKIIRKILSDIIQLSENNIVLLTCRFNYLFSDTNIRNKLSMHNIVKIKDFIKEDIEKFLDRRFDDQKIIDEIYLLIENKKINELARKPLFLDAICNNRKDILKYSLVNESVIFEILIKNWINYDPSTQKDPQMNILIRSSEIVAVDEYNNKKTTLPRIKKRIFEEFGNEKSTSEDNIEEYCNNVQFCTFLIIDDDGNFRFSLPALMEYFLARRIVRDIGEGNESAFWKDTAGILGINVIEFIKSIIHGKIANPSLYPSLKEYQNIHSNLTDFIMKGKTQNLANAIMILNKIGKLSPSFDFTGLKLTGANLSGLQFTDAKFRRTNLRNAILNGVDFSALDMQGVHLDGAELENADFTGTDLKGATITNSNLSNSNLRRSIITDVDFTGSDLTHVDLSNSTTNENNKKLSFSNTLLFHTDLEGATIPNAIFSDAFLWQTDVSEANLENADFQRAIFHYVRIRDTNFKKAQFQNVGVIHSPLTGNTETVNSKNISVFKKILKENDSDKECKKYDKFCKALCSDGNKLIRYVGIISETREILHHVRNKEEEFRTPLLMGKDKSILAHYSWITWKLLKHIEDEEGFKDEREWAVTIFQELKIITMPIADNILLVTMPPTTPHKPIIEWVKDNQKYLKKNPKGLQDFEFEEIEKDNPLKITATKKREKFNSTCRKIIQNPDVTYVGIFDKSFSKVFDDSRNKKNKLHKIINKGFREDFWRRWRFRLKFADKIGQPICSITKYENKITISSLIGNGEYLLLIVTNHNVEQEKLEKIINSMPC